MKRHNFPLSIIYPPKRPATQEPVIDENRGADPDEIWAVRLVQVFFWTTIFGGPIRYISILISIPLYLLPKALLLIPVLRLFFGFKATARHWCVVSLLLLLCAVGLVHGLRPFQVAFGLWTIFPFLVGILFPRVIVKACTTRACVALLSACIFGELLSYFVDFPWSGMGAEFGGVTTRAAKDWQTSEGLKRLAGLSDSSMGLSVAMAIFGTIVSSRRTGLHQRAAIFLLVGLAIWLTTMKTALGAYLLIAAAVFFPSRAGRLMTAIGGLFALALGTALPYLSTASFDASTLIERLKQMETLRERLEITWPNVLEYLRQNDAGLLGIGVGGLGSAATLGVYSMNFGAADNCYLYILAISGLVGAVFLLIFAWKLAVEWRYNNAERTWALPVLVFFAIYCCTQPLIDTSIPAMFLGALVFIPAADSLSNTSNTLERLPRPLSAVSGA